MSELAPENNQRMHELVMKLKDLAKYSDKEAANKEAVGVLVEALTLLGQLDIVVNYKKLNEYRME
ncbi:hypothetical protein [Paenibacillus sedimenti]|uniref:Uncharacterized protein n=1 Tax=Paenibacillus sedimenti TaxID=2770274 RepID=A0A926KNW4_9BACL|nr:hypothetical protein [Paenibacillus sedimenti]MBD0381304.1 hypothetical protein [Paenibacillus sedimenti]